MPCPKRKGQTFKRWKTTLENLGYVVEFRELRACDYGAPTIRKRLFLVARCDGAPIVWPAPTHGAPDSLPVQSKKLKPYLTAAECIDWSIPAPSIFTRDRPLAEATLRRIAKGIMRYVVNADAPFIINTRNGERKGQKPRVRSIHEPAWTVTAQGSQHALVTAFIAKHYGGVVGSDQRNPLGTVTSRDSNALVTANLIAIDNKTSAGAQFGADEPLRTTTAKNRHAIVAANLIHLGHGESSASGRRWSHGVRDAQMPLNTITASGAPGALVTSNLIKLRGTSNAAATDEPLHTVSAGGTHHAEVRAFLLKYYGTDQDPRLDEPLHTQTTKARFGLVVIKGELYHIGDIGMRMLTPRELYRAQGFPESYLIEQGADGKSLTKTAQVRMCGNSVCPPVAAALVRANYTEAAAVRKVA